MKWELCYSVNVFNETLRIFKSANILKMHCEWSWNPFSVCINSIKNNFFLKWLKVPVCSLYASSIEETGLCHASSASCLQVFVQGRLWYKWTLIESFCISQSQWYVVKFCAGLGKLGIVMLSMFCESWSMKMRHKLQFLSSAKSSKMAKRLLRTRLVLDDYRFHESTTSMQLLFFFFFFFFL